MCTPELGLGCITLYFPSKCKPTNCKPVRRGNPRSDIGILFSAFQVSWANAVRLKKQFAPFRDFIVSGMWRHSQLSLQPPIASYTWLWRWIILQNFRKHQHSIICTTTYLLSQLPASERMHCKPLLLWSWIKKYIYSLWSHAGKPLHNGIWDP